MADRAQMHHERMVRLFQGKIGEGVYGSAILLGPKRREIVSMQAYVALYPIEGFAFIKLTEPMDLTLHTALRRIISLHMSSDDSPQQPIPHAHHRSDDVLWARARSRTRPLLLPTAFVSFVVNVAGHQKIVFWHPRLVPAGWMLHQFQQQARIYLG